ncbi:MAG: hypothetical protein Q4G26_06185 [Paracoccus sp. (in: a-proteobacteria)]|nr:hypothetical protein [Paracoccus sp. (in: a-proteobacteria)]
MNSRRDRVARAHKVAAYFTAHGGTAFLPIFERMERDLAALDTTASAIERARRIAQGG